MEAMNEGDVAAFTHLGQAVRDALSARGFEVPTQPQRLAIPPIAEGRHTLVVAPTGTGKTEAAMLPILDALVTDGERTGIGALYITPLRALNRDMLERLEWWGEHLGLDVQVRHGDTGDYRRRQQAVDPPDVLITTPETVQAMLTGSRLREGLATVEHVVIDEVHELAASKRGAQLSVALERLVDLAGEFQRVGLSATVGNPDLVAAFLTGGRAYALRQLDIGGSLEVHVRYPEVVQADEPLADRLLVDPTMASHLRVILELVDAHHSTLIFVNTRQTAEALGSRFNALGASIGVHHGSLSKAARLEVEDAFKSGELDGLVCTSSMELGIDVGHVDHVIQYGSPRQVTRIVQRVGRAGHRVGATSRGTIIATNPDDAIESIVIAELARQGSIEPVEIHAESLDTVANQLVGMTHSRDGVSLDTALACFNRTLAFAELDRTVVELVSEELASNRVIWYDREANRLETAGRTWQYVYDNLSMIPDEATYDVTDVASGGKVGTLDERFVVGFAEPGATFIQGGEMWRIVTLEDDAVQVAPVEDPTGEVPSWVGEEIPVPVGVATAVGRLRGELVSQSGGHTASNTGIDAPESLAEAYQVSPDLLERVIPDITEQLAYPAPVPTDEQLLIDEADDTITVHHCGGHRINEAIGRLLSALLGQRTGSSVGLESDPYRIHLTVPHDIEADTVAELLTSVDPSHVEPLLEMSLRGSQEVGYRLAHVGKKFGAIESIRARGPTSSWRRLVAIFDGTPLIDEAIRELFHDDLDAEGASRSLQQIQEGALAIESVRGPTPLSTSGRRSGTELLRPERADASVIKTVRERLHDADVRLVCLHCDDYDQERTIDGLPQQPRCPHCDSTRIAAVSPWADELVAARDGRDEATEADRKRLYRNASLVQSHGKRAIIAMAGRGVGPQTAARIINNHREDERDFYRDILAAEREYARTRSFWD